MQYDIPYTNSSYKNSVEVTHHKSTIIESSFKIPKPIASIRTSTNGQKDRENNCNVETTNSSPMSHWNITLNKNDTERTNQCSEFRILSAEESKSRSRAFTESRSQCVSLNTAGKNCFNGVKPFTSSDKNKIPKRRKSKLIALNKLHSLLTKLFLNQRIDIQDFNLRPFDLHILVEILIRKNRNACHGR